MLSKRLLLVASASTLALMIAGCGSGGGDDSSGSNTSGAGGSGTGTLSNNDAGQGTGNDAFLAQVRAVINTTSETTEPTNIDSAPASLPESAQPEPLG